MKQLVLLLLLFTISFGKIDLESGDFVSIKVTMLENGNVNKVHEYKGMICDDNQIVLQDMIAKFKVDNKGICLYPYNSDGVLINGKIDRTNIKAKRVFPFESPVEDNPAAVIKTEVNVIEQKDPNPFGQYAGYWGSKSNLSDGWFIINDDFYTQDIDAGISVKILSVDEKGKAKIRTSISGQSDERELNLSDERAVHLTPALLDSVLNNLYPVEQTKPINEILEIYSKIPNAEKPKDVAASILKNFVKNNYYILTKESMLAINYYLNSPEASRLESLAHVLEEYLGKKGFSDKKSIERKIDKILVKKKVEIKEKDKDNVAKKLFLLYLTETSKIETKEQQDVFNVIVNCVQYL